MCSLTGVRVGTDAIPQLPSGAKLPGNVVALPSGPTENCLTTQWLRRVAWRQAGYQSNRNFKASVHWQVSSGRCHYFVSQQGSP